MEALLYFTFFLLLVFYILFILQILRGIRNIAAGVNSDSLPQEFVTVIVPFRNESENILKSLQSLTGQDYPAEKFEVLYINDCSDDDSLEKITRAAKPANIKVFSVQNSTKTISYKKQAVLSGIEKARGEIIVTTDCDCWHGSAWLRTLLSCYDDDTAFVSGPVSFINDKSLFGRLQTIEFAGLVLAGAGLIGIKKPVICNAANLSFRKKVFFDVNGYTDNMHLSSGDDEFLMRKIAAETDYKIKFCFRKNALSFTNANRKLGDFYQQRKRWASKSRFYNKSLILMLSLIFLFFLSLPLQLILGLLISYGFIVSFLSALIIKVLLEFAVIKKGKKLLLADLEIKYFLAAELFHIPYIISAVISGMFGNFEWKDRRLKR